MRGNREHADGVGKIRRRRREITSSIGVQQSNQKERGEEGKGIVLGEQRHRAHQSGQ